MKLQQPVNLGKIDKLIDCRFINRLIIYQYVKDNEKSSENERYSTLFSLFFKRNKTVSLSFIQRSY
ncbi:hypothetical protein J2S02_000516 [Metabacillus niabensis]|uniref:Uncharacterized protein n=1 Tax=Metabacillus niabensis TaxID=324854 RepID=A0ABT9YWV0_9BACI|nr:hypothetical protein [Metabacillus niabensis]